MTSQLEKASELLREKGVALAVLFGSRARGEATARSDWDIGVIGSPGLELLRLSAELGRALGGSADVVDFRRASPLLCYAAMREGKVLVDATGSEFARFASLTLRRYNDTAKLRAAQSESLDRFVAERTAP